jgi:hypothetical protein
VGSTYVNVFNETQERKYSESSVINFAQQLLYPQYMNTKDNALYRGKALGNTPCVDLLGAVGLSRVSD